MGKIVKMTNQYYISYYRSLKAEVPYLRFSIVLILILALNTIGFNFEHIAIITMNLILGLILMIILFSYFQKYQKVPFVEINNGVLNYFDTERNEIIQISAQDITHISTRFCELRVHTHEKVHILNLDVIRNETKRWEIKEKIRKLKN
jgi:hypothetical protein